MQLEKGKWYKSRDGWYIACIIDTELIDGENLTVSAITTKLTADPGVRRRYTSDGHYRNDKTESGWDLVEIVPNPYAPTKVKIVVEGGCVVSVESNHPIEYEIEDRDL